MSLGTDIEKIAEKLIDLHVGLHRARHLAEEIDKNSCCEMRAVEELFEEFDQMQMDIERLMDEVK